MDLHYATTNQGKLLSLTRDLEPFGITVIQAALDIPEPRSSDVEEIARAKALFAFSQLRKPVVVLDAGFYIDALNGFPRAFVNFTLETIGLPGILKLLEDKNRKCEFRECLAYLDDALADPKCFTVHNRGQIAFGIRGELRPDHWSPLAQIFIPRGEETTIAEMGKESYARWREIYKKETVGKNFAEWFLSR